MGFLFEAQLVGMGLGRTTGWLAHAVTMRQQTIKWMIFIEYSLPEYLYYREDKSLVQYPSHLKMQIGKENLPNPDIKFTISHLIIL
jgi:hypothetical protein